MLRQARGFSLIELLMALLISLALSMILFQLFHLNERAIRDQTLIMEMQQTARVVASQIADEIRMAGEGVPVYSSSLDAIPSEAAAVFIGSSTANRIDFRAGLSNTETTGTGTVPMDLSIGASRVVSVSDTSGFSIGKFVYLTSGTTWLRAEVTNVSPSALTLIPRETEPGHTLIHFSAPPLVSLEEAVSMYLSGGSVRRATASDMSNPASPAWSPANELGRNFSSLTFTYYDASGSIRPPDSLANRLSIARVDINLTVEAASPLTNGTRPSYSLALRTIPRNVRIRSAN